MQHWKKLGQIFKVNQNYDWMYSHASVPIAENIKDDIFKIYFTTRNSNNESSIAFVIIDLNYPNKILEISHKPLLEKGQIGTFDDSGTMGSCIINKGNDKYLYYIGWNLGVTVPFRNSIGLAVSKDSGQTFNKVFEGPILDRTKDEPYFTASNHVIEENGIYKIWYLSCTDWKKKNNKLIHNYHIKYAESTNGIDWVRKGIVAIDYIDKYEYAISVPRVIKEDGIYKMWFSSRATKDIETYRIKYAESTDGKVWQRKDEEIDLNVSRNGWDSQMICYPFVFDHKGKRYMLYNGNDYGKTGFGLAVLEIK